MTEDTRQALLEEMFGHLAKAQAIVRVLADAQIEPVEPVETRPDDEEQDGCEHPEDKRRDTSTMGGGPTREMCLACGETLTNGRPSTDDASEETG